MAEQGTTVLVKKRVRRVHTAFLYKKKYEYTDGGGAYCTLLLPQL